MNAPSARALAVVAAMAGLSALSLLVSSSPGTDAWGWIVWGREVTHLDLFTALGGAPAWKPLPVLFTTPYSLAGEDVASALWLVTARVAALVALVVVYRLGTRLAGRPAGVGAACLLTLSGDFARGMTLGYTEPLMVALTLGALDRHLAGRRGQALALLLLAALGRPEGFAFLVGYCCWLAWDERRVRRAAPLALALVPVLWLGGDWWGSGDPFHAEQMATAISREGAGIQPQYLMSVLGPALVALAIAGCVSSWRAGRRGAAGLGALTLGWTVCVVAPVLQGSAGSNRFLMPAVAGVCILAAVGVAELGRGANPAFRSVS